MGFLLPLEDRVDRLERINRDMDEAIRGMAYQQQALRERVKELEAFKEGMRYEATRSSVPV